MAVRTTVRRHTIKVGGDKYRVGKSATRSVAKADNTKTVSTTKKAGGTINRSVTRSDTGTHGYKIGAYAKAHATTNEDGSVTYATKSGGTKTVAMSVSDSPKTKAAAPPAKDKPPKDNGGDKKKNPPADTTRGKNNGGDKKKPKMPEATATAPKPPIKPTRPNPDKSNPKNDGAHKQVDYKPGFPKKNKKYKVM